MIIPEAYSSCKSWGRSVSTATRLWDGRPRIRSPIEKIKFFYFQIVQPSSGAHTAPYLTCTVVLPRWESGRGIMLTTRLHLIPRLRMNRAIHLFPIYTFMVWTCSSVDDICALLGCYAVNSCNSLKMFRNNRSAPSSRVMNLSGFLAPEGGRSYLLRGRGRKSRPSNCTFIHYADLARWEVLNLFNHQALSECQLFIQFRIR